MIVEKIKAGWGFDVQSKPDSNSVVLVYDDITGYQIAYWPTDNPPKIEEIEAVVLTEPTQPDWSTFRLSMIQSQAFLRITNTNSALFVMLNSVMWLIDSDSSKLQETVLIWNQLAKVAQPTSDEIIELNNISSKNNIPLKLNENGFMTI